MTWAVETRKAHSRVWHLQATYDTDMQCYAWGQGLPRAYRTRYRDTVTGEVVERWWWCPKRREPVCKVYRLQATPGDCTTHGTLPVTVPPTGH